MADDFGWEREWPGWPEFHVREFDVLMEAVLAVFYECPRCGGLVRAPARGKHEVVCWGPEPAEESVRNVAPFPRELADYTRLVEALLRNAPELGEHLVTDVMLTTDVPRPHGQISVHAYGQDYRITIERIE